MEGTIITAIAGGIASLGAFIVGFRRHSGNVSSTDADSLLAIWKDELKRMSEAFAIERKVELDARMVLRSDLDASEKRERECMEQSRRTEKELHELRLEVAILREKVSTFERQGEALARERIENAALRAASLVKAEAATAALEHQAHETPREVTIVQPLDHPVPVVLPRSEEKP